MRSTLRLAYWPLRVQRSSREEEVLGFGLDQKSGFTVSYPSPHTQGTLQYHEYRTL